MVLPRSLGTLFLEDEKRHAILSTASLSAASGPGMVSEAVRPAAFASEDGGVGGGVGGDDAGVVGILQPIVAGGDWCGEALGHSVSSANSRCN